jgi:SAM-dependent methyltransferase
MGSVTNELISFGNISLDDGSGRSADKVKVEVRIMISNLFDDRLHEIDKELPFVEPSEVPRLFRDVPLDIFGVLLLDLPDRFPNIKKFFPSMVSDEVQDQWTGCHGIPLLSQSLAFVKTVVPAYNAITGKTCEEAIVLDFGCGWGRLIRLLYKYVPSDKIFAVDPFDQSLNICRKHGVKCNLAQSDYVPRNLPFERQFDLIYSFSVFTHLSEKTAHVVLHTLRRYISDAGLLAVTVRPKEYWYAHEGGTAATGMIKLHEETGFAFIPHERPPVDGDITYGDTSISLDYFRKNFPQWNLVTVEYNLVDPYQVILFLQPKSERS